MSFFVRRPYSERAGESLLQGYVAPRGANTAGGSVHVSADTAMRHSAIWACVRTRADLISTFPVDVYRKVGDVRVEMPKPEVLIDTGGEHWDYPDWMWASQSDLDKAGNAIGLITGRNAAGLPSRIELQPINSCSVLWRRGTPLKDRIYKIDGKEYKPEVVWHERQFPVAGLPVGLNPVAAAAWTIGEYLSIQKFALDWFGGGAVPKAQLTHKGKTIPSGDSEMMKERFKATLQNGDIFVHGSDWEYDMIQAQDMGNAWIQAKEFGLADVCRFFGCPADLIDAAISGGGKVTYANITERNLQFLIHHLGPAVVRREKNLSKLLPSPRYVKLNTQALLRMDPKAMAEIIDMRIANKTMTNTEARALNDELPLTDEQMKEFKKIYGGDKKVPAKTNPKANVEPDEEKAPEVKSGGGTLTGREIEMIEKMNRKGAISC